MGAVSAVGVCAQIGLHVCLVLCGVCVFRLHVCLCRVVRSLKVRTRMLVQSGSFLEGSGGVSCGLVGVLVRLVRWRGAWAFIVVCVSGWVGGVVRCAVTVV